MASQKLRTQLKYQKRPYDLKLEENHYEVGDFVYRLNSTSKVGESKKLKPVWLGPLVVTAVINPVLFHVKDRKNEFVLHHDRLKPCKDRVVPLWMCQMHHNMLDLDTTLAYDEAEQAEEVPPSTLVSPSVGPFSTPGVPDDSDEVPEPSTRELEPLTLPSCQSLDSDTAGEGDNWEPGPPSSQPFVSFFADTKVKEATDLFLGEEELGLDKLKKQSMSMHRSPRFHGKV